MTKPSSPQDEARRERLRAALRENLKRRKAQAKARAAGPDEADDSEAGVAAPPSVGKD